MRTLNLFLQTLLIIYVGLVIYNNRAIFFSRFDESYWKNKYEQSQWKLPLSQRTIGDDGLYLYEGYRLIHGADPTSSNAEMPPLGKYLIGASILLFDNGHIYGLMTTLTLIAGVFVLVKSLLKLTTHALWIAVLLATDPLITNQYTLTMMDSLQASLLVLFFVVLFKAEGKYKPYVVLLSGILLGLFSQTKLPILTPAIGIAGTWYLWMKTKNILFLTIFYVGGVVGYIAPYAIYFAQGNTIIEWIKVQKWIISFYTNSNLTPTWGSVITTLVAGTYQNIFSRLWERASEWSPSWGLLLFSSIGALGVYLRTPKKDARWGLLFIVLLSILAAYAGIPFWTRYLVTLLPLLYVACALLFSRLPTSLSLIVYTMVLITNIVASVHILYPSPRATVNQILYNIETMQFADLYEDTTASFRKETDRETFRRFALTTMADGHIEDIDITYVGPPISSKASAQQIPVTITYYTRHLGAFTQQVDIPIVKEKNRWKIPWEWSVLLPGLTSQRRLETSVIPAKRGSILASDKKPLAEDVWGSVIWVTPGKIDKTKEESLLALLETVLDGRQPKVAIHQGIVGNTLPNLPTPIGVIRYTNNDPNMVTLARYEGVTFTDTFTRIVHPNNIVEIGEVKNSLYSECCTVLYSTTSYDGVSGIEKAKNATLKGIHGGTLILKDHQGNIIKTFIEKTKRDGLNVDS